MVLTLGSFHKEDTTVAFVSDRRLYLTADKSAVVEEGDSAAAYLLVGKGGEVTTAMVQRHGLVDPAKAKEEAAKKAAANKVEPADAAPEEKAVVPVANKAVMPAANK